MKFLNDPIGLVRALGKTVSTNVPRKRLPEFVDLAVKIDRKSTYRTVIKYPLVHGAYDQRGSIQVPNVKEIRKLAAAVHVRRRDARQGIQGRWRDEDRARHDVRHRQLRRSHDAEAEVDAEADAEADGQADAEAVPPTPTDPPPDPTRPIRHPIRRRRMRPTDARAGERQQAAS